MAKKQTTKKLPKNTSAQWTAASRLLRNLETDEMLDMFRQLYLLSPDNAKLIDSKFKQGGGGKLLEEYRQKIEHEFFPPGRFCPDSFPRMGWMKSLIRDYRKGTGDLPGTAELMVTFQEQGMLFTMEYGDINERFYDSLLSGMNDLITVLTKDAPELFPAFRDRLIEIVRRVFGRVGWGYGDGLYETVSEICDFHGLDFQYSRDGRLDHSFKIVAKE